MSRTNFGLAGGKGLFLARSTTVGEASIHDMSYEAVRA